MRSALAFCVILSACRTADPKDTDTEGMDETAVEETGCVYRPPDLPCEEEGEYYHRYACGTCDLVWACGTYSEGAEWGQSGMPCRCINDDGTANTDDCSWEY